MRRCYCCNQKCVGDLVACQNGRCEGLCCSACLINGFCKPCLGINEDEEFQQEIDKLIQKENEMTTLKNKFLEPFLDNMLLLAAKQREDAGYSGSYSDGGASVIEGKVQALRCGLKGEMLPEWEHIYLKFIEVESNKEDPEYGEYLRLKEKFGNVK